MLVSQFLEAYYLNSILLQRDILRLRGEFTQADGVRDKLSEIGIKVIDCPYGSEWEFGYKKLAEVKNEVA